MYRNEMLPQCIMIGIHPDEFWRLNPRKLKPYFEAEKLKEERLDTQMWLMGGYVFEAVGIAIGNALRGKGKRAISYPDKPHFANVREQRGELTEEEKIAKTKMLFSALNIMKTNHDLEKKYQDIQAS